MVAGAVAGNISREATTLSGNIFAEAMRGIAAGTFRFTEEFPDFRFRAKLPLALRARTCAEVFDAFLEHEATRVYAATSRQ